MATAPATAATTTPRSPASVTVPDPSQFISATSEAAARDAVLREYFFTRDRGLLPAADSVNYSFVSHLHGSVFKTACWSFDEKRQSHRIFIGKGLWSNAVERLQKVSIGGYYAAFYRHEFGHALFTERNMDRIQEALKRQGIPFSLFNLFEDARIEHAMRKAFSTRFNWEDYEERKLPKKPLERFFQLIHKEAGERRSYNIRALPVDASADKREMTIASRFYREAILCKSTMDLMPLMARWMKHFPSEISMDATGWREADVSPESVKGENFSVQDADGKLIPFDESPEVAEDDKRQLAGRGTEFSNTDIETVKKKAMRRFLREDFLRSRMRTLNDSLGLPAQAAKRMRSHFTGTTRMEATTESQPKFHLRNFALGRRDIFSEKVVGQRFIPPKIVVCLDCSGSMNHAHPETVLMVLFFNELAKMGAINGHLMLSKIKGQSPINAVIKLPLKDNHDILAIGFDGDGEGIEPAFAANEKLLSQAHLLVCVTDAHITDKPIDKRRWNKLGVRSIGCYIGEETAAPSLQNYFDLHLIKPDFISMVAAMAPLIRRVGQRASTGRSTMAASGGVNPGLPARHKVQETNIESTGIKR